MPAFAAWFLLKVSVQNNFWAITPVFFNSLKGRPYLIMVLGATVLPFSIKHAAVQAPFCFGGREDGPSLDTTSPSCDRQRNGRHAYNRGAREPHTNALYYHSVR